MSDDKEPSPMEELVASTLGDGVELPSLGLLDVDRVTDMAEEIVSTAKRLVDVPADVYRYVTGLPDEPRLRRVFVELGPEAVPVVEPLVRGMQKVSDIVPTSRVAQPVFVGKVFGCRDYVQDRLEMLKGIPELPAELKREIQDVGQFAQTHGTDLAAVSRVLPESRELRRMSDPLFWKDVFGDEWSRFCDEVDPLYAKVVREPDRLARDLPIFRIAYAIAYAGLGQLDPITGLMRKHGLGTAAAYQRFAGRRDMLERLLAKLRAAGVEHMGPAAAAEAAPQVEREQERVRARRAEQKAVEPSTTELSEIRSLDVTAEPTQANEPASEAGDVQATPPPSPARLSNPPSTALSPANAPSAAALPADGATLDWAPQPGALEPTAEPRRTELKSDPSALASPPKPWD